MRLAASVGVTSSALPEAGNPMQACALVSAAAGEEAGGYMHHWENTFEIDLSKRFELDVSFLRDRVSHPATSAGGTTTKPDDLRMIV